MFGGNKNMDKVAMKKECPPSQPEIPVQHEVILKDGIKLTFYFSHDSHDCNTINFEMIWTSVGFWGTEQNIGFGWIQFDEPCTLVTMRHSFRNEGLPISLGPFHFSKKRSLCSILNTVAKLFEPIFIRRNEWPYFEDNIEYYYDESEQDIVEEKAEKNGEGEMQPEKKDVWSTDMNQLIAEAKQSIDESQKLINDGQECIDKAKVMLSEKIEMIESVMNLLGKVHQEMQTLYNS